MAAALLTSADISRSQVLLRTIESPNPQPLTHFGAPVAMADADGDSRADIAVGAPNEDVNGNADQGRVYLFSGASGAVR